MNVETFRYCGNILLERDVGTVELSCYTKKFKELAYKLTVIYGEAMIIDQLLKLFFVGSTREIQ